LLRHTTWRTLSFTFIRNMTKSAVLGVCHWEGKRKVIAAAIKEQTCSQSTVTKYTSLPC